MGSKVKGRWRWSRRWSGNGKGGIEVGLVGGPGARLGEVLAATSGSAGVVVEVVTQ